MYDKVAICKRKIAKEKSKQQKKMWDALNDTGERTFEVKFSGSYTQFNLIVPREVGRDITELKSMHK
jgi:hypothetical protein